MFSFGVAFVVSLITVGLRTCGVLGQQYQPNWDSLDSRPLPLWYDEAKFGIFCHWGVYSVTAFNNEWFWFNLVDMGDAPNIQFMQTHYKPNTTYQDLAHEFTAIDFNATLFAQIIKSSGARYFVLTTKHHEGFTLWPSAVQWNWNAVDLGPHRDLVGEIRDAILAASGIRWGTYFSLMEWYHPLMISDQQTGRQDYVNAIMYPQIMDLVNTYKPDILWGDGEYISHRHWFPNSTYWRTAEFLAWLYNESPVKDTVVANDRWGYDTECRHGGFLTCHDRYLPSTIPTRKWENANTVDKGSWGFRRSMQVSDAHTLEELVTYLVQTIALGGNFLLNIGPDSRGRVLPLFEERLRDIGIFVNAHEEAIFSTKPWIYQSDDNDKSVWYTSQLRNSSGFDPYRLYNLQQQNNTIIYAFVLKWPDNNLINLPHIIPTSRTMVNLFSTTGPNIPIPFKQIVSMHDGIQVDISNISFKKFPSPAAFVFKIEYAADQCPANFVKNSVNSQECLAFVSNNTYDWQSANSQCGISAPGASLASISSTFENSEIAGMVKNCTTAYIGLYKNGTNWNWVNGNPLTYTNWASGYPTNDSNSTCVTITQSDGKWMNQNCALTSCFICKLTN